MYRFSHSEQRAAIGLVNCINDEEIRKAKFMKAASGLAKDRGPPNATEQCKAIFSKMFNEARAIGALHDRLCNQNLTQDGSRAEAAGWALRDGHLYQVMALMGDFADLGKERPSKLFNELWAAIQP